MKLWITYINGNNASCFSKIIITSQKVHYYQQECENEASSEKKINSFKFFLNYLTNYNKASKIYLIYTKIVPKLGFCKGDHLWPLE